MISKKHKCIFVHIPKTAGSSIELFLDPNLKTAMNGDTVFTQENKHSKAIDYYSQDPDLFSRYFSFSFVRNPWDLVVSRYFYRKNWDSNFDLSIKGFLLGNFSWNCCFNYLCVNDEISVNFVGRFENLQDDFDIVCDKIGIPQQQLLHANKSNHKQYTEYYDDETREIVAKKFAKDIEYFGYKFGE